MNTWEANIRKVVPYTPGEQPNQPDMIKLNSWRPGTRNCL